MIKVLVVGTARKTRGGITSVLKAFEKTETWNKYHCKWIETYIDRSSILKVIYFLKGFSIFLVLLPFYNLVHIHFSWTKSAYRKIFFFLYARLLKKKIIVHLHSGAEPIIQSKAKNYYKYIFKHADISVFLAQVIKDEIAKNYLIKNSEIVYNPCLDIPQTGIKKAALRNNTILFAGKLCLKKGVFDLIDAFGKIAPKYQNWQLVLAGNGEIEKGKLLAKNYNIQNQVKFTGWINGTEKIDLFQNSSIFCLPSYTEGFPMAVLDAWSYGIPVITTNVGGLPDVIIHRKNAMVFKPGDTEILKNNLDALIKNAELRQEISDNSVILSKKLFSIKNFSSKIEELYKNV